MTSRGLDARSKALEGAFFARQDRALIEALREKQVARDLEAVTGIHDAEALALLIREGIRVETLVALLLVPVVAIAWADGRVTALEQNKLHAELQRIGIRPSSPAGEILESWLATPPPPGLMQAWCDYVEELERTTSTEAFAELADRIARLCREEADSDGGVLRVGRRVSKAEAAILDRVERALALV